MKSRPKNLGNDIPDVIPKRSEESSGAMVASPWARHSIRTPGINPGATSHCPALRHSEAPLIKRVGHLDVGYTCTNGIVGL